MDIENIESIFPNQEVVRLAEKEEPRFLSILLKNKDKLMDAISSGIIASSNKKPGHFLVGKNNVLYMLMQKNYEKYHTTLTRSAIDSILDMQDFGTDEQKTSLKSYWDQVWGRADASLEDYDMLKEHLNDRYVLWQFIEKWKKGNKIVTSTSNQVNLIKEFTKDINLIDNVDPDPYILTMGIDEGTDKALKYIEDRRNHPEKHIGILTGIKALDDIYNGLECGSYTVLSAMTNGGKTTLMTNIGFNMAKAGYNVVYVSLEKEVEPFFRRILSLHALTDYNRIKKGGKEQWGLSDYWYARLTEAARDIRENIKPNYDCIQLAVKTKMSKVMSEIDKIRASKKIDVLIVDYLQAIGVETHHSTRPDLDLADVHQRLQSYGRIHRLVTITALQLKGSSTKTIRDRVKKVTGDVDSGMAEVNTEDYSGSQIVVNDADNAWGLVLNADKPPTKMYVTISKARNDESKGSIKTLDFDGRTGRVSDQDLAPGQIRDATDILYSSNITEEQIKSEDGLFLPDKPKTKESKEDIEIEKPKEPEEPKAEEMAVETKIEIKPQEDDFLEDNKNEALTEVSTNNDFNNLDELLGFNDD
jgi:replicative DNA helicase